MTQWDLMVAYACPLVSKAASTLGRYHPSVNLRERRVARSCEDTRTSLIVVLGFEPTLPAAGSAEIVPCQFLHQWHDHRRYRNTSV